MRVNYLFVFIILILSFVSCTKKVVESEQVTKNDNIFQYGTMEKFLNRDFDGNLTIKNIKKHGDFGLGTYNGVDGEMVVYKGKVYRILPEGKAFEVSDSELSPFTVVKFFESDTSFSLNESTGLEDLKIFLKNNISDSTKPLAIRISGEFEKVKTRTVEKQNKPYPPLAEIVANQIEFNFENITGSAIGFWFPPFYETINFPNFHFHFMKDEIAGGGHLLDCTISNVIIEFDCPDELKIGF